MIEVDTGKFKAALLKAQLNLIEVATQARLNPLTVAKLVKGNCRVRFKTLGRLAALLQVEPDTLTAKEV